MSGGHFDYKQFQIGEVADEIEEYIEKNGKKKTVEELSEDYFDSDWYAKYPEDLVHHKYSHEVVERFKEGVEAIKKAQIYIHRIDWLLSGDDGEESFLKRLDGDLKDNRKT